jgi:cytoskeletal protein RodZ
MLIAILVLLGLAGAIWYFARKQTQAIITLTQEDVNSTSTMNESAFTTPEVASEKAFIQAQQDALAEAQAAKVEVDAIIAKADKAIAKADEVLNAPVAEVVAPAETKPKKKKRYYKPKAK